MPYSLHHPYHATDQYYSTTGQPVSILMPAASSAFEYTSISDQQLMTGLSTAIEANRWIEGGSTKAWSYRLREWVHACVSTQTVGGTSCLGRQCVLSSGALALPYCSYAKQPRGASATPLTDTSGAVVAPAAETKFMVLADGSPAPDNTPLSQVYLPPSKLYEWLDQFTADEALGKVRAAVRVAGA